MKLLAQISHTESETKTMHIDSLNLIENKNAQENIIKRLSEMTYFAINNFQDGDFDLCF